MTLVNPSVSTRHSYPSRWAARPICLAVSLLGRPACALHPGSSRPLCRQHAAGWLDSPQSSLLLWCSWAYLPRIHGPVTLAAVVRYIWWLLPDRPVGNVF